MQLGGIGSQIPGIKLEWLWKLFEGDLSGERQGVKEQYKQGKETFHKRASRRLDEKISRK
jgi:hypothetical protein